MSDHVIKYNGWHSTKRLPPDLEAPISVSGGWNAVHGRSVTISLRRDNPNTGKPEIIELFLDKEAARSVHGMIEHVFLDEQLCPRREKSLHHEATCDYCAPRIKAREARWEKAEPILAEHEKQNRRGD